LGGKKRKKKRDLITPQQDWEGEGRTHGEKKGEKQVFRGGNRTDEEEWRILYQREKKITTTGKEKKKKEEPSQKCTREN